jgi:DNA-binding NarL/FixJ family response regulator
MRELEQEHTLRRRQSAQARLTHREEDVLRLIAMGRDNPDIGAELFISSSTVKRHVGTILAKLEVCNRVQAAAEAVRIGIA